MSSFDNRSKSNNLEQINLSPLIAALDIGANKITCFIARSTQQSGPLRIVGVGSLPSKGVKNGLITDLEAVERNVKQVLDTAEVMAGGGVSDVIVSVSGFGLKAKQVFGAMNFPNGCEIGEKQLRRVIRQATESLKLDNKYMLHATPTYYKVDKQIVKDPSGMFARRLEVSSTVVTVPIGIWNNLMLCVARTNRNVIGTLASPYAAALSVLGDDEIENGALVVDMGARSTTAALFYNGSLAHVDAVPIGSDHITQDIAQCFETSSKAAEKLKILHGSAIGSLNEEDQYIDAPRYNDEGVLVSSRTQRSYLTGIVRPRVEETLELLRDRLYSKRIDKSIYGRRIVLTGGGAQLNGVRELAARVFEGHVRIGRPQRYAGLSDIVSGPAFAVCSGLLRWSIERPNEITKIAKEENEKQVHHPVIKAYHWLKDNFWA